MLSLQKATIVRVVRDFPVPTKEKSLREFLGLASYYRHFVPWSAKVAGPLAVPDSYKQKLMEENHAGSFGGHFAARGL